MSEARPARHAEPVTKRRDLTRIICAAAGAAFAIGYLVADFGGDSLNVLARIVAIVALVLLPMWIFQMHMTRRLDQLEARLDRAEYWRVYSDVMSDLGGGSGEDSGEIPVERAPRR